MYTYLRNSVLSLGDVQPDALLVWLYTYIMNDRLYLKEQYLLKKVIVASLYKCYYSESLPFHPASGFARTLALDSYFKISNMTEKLRIYSQLLVHKNLAEENQANLWLFTKFTKIFPCQSFCIVSEVHNKFKEVWLTPKWQ